VIAVIVMACILGVLLVAFLWFYFYSRTISWGESETRKAMLRMLVVVGPIFGMHYKPPRPEPPTISTPGPEDRPGIPGVVLPPDDEPP